VVGLRGGLRRVAVVPGHAGVEQAPVEDVEVDVAAVAQRCRAAPHPRKAQFGTSTGGRRAP
jgi:hypothetical protein